MLILSTARDTWLLFSHPVAVGADGYYYVLQVDALLKTHHLYFPTYTPLVFYFLAGLSILTRNAILAIKLGSIGFNVALSLCVFFLISSICRNRWLGFLGAAITSLSGMHFYMIAEFIKNLAGVTLFMWGAQCAIRASNKASSSLDCFDRSTNHIGSSEPHLSVGNSPRVLRAPPAGEVFDQRAAVQTDRSFRYCFPPDLSSALGFPEGRGVTAMVGK